MNKSCEKNPTAHSQNILHVDVLHNIKRKKFKTVCAELAFAKSPSTEWQFVPTIYRTGGEHANHYATDVVPYFYFIFIIFLINFFLLSFNILFENKN
jgi:hypothetical protein